MINVKWKEIWSLFRWKIFIPMLVFFTVGLKFYHAKIGWDILILFVFLAVSQFFGFAINNYYDYGGDKLNKNRKSGALKRDAIKNKGYILYSLIVEIILLIFISLMFNTKIIFCSFIVFLIMVFYSMPPIRFKEIPILDFFSNILLYGSIVLIGAYYSSDVVSWKLLAFPLLGGVFHLYGVLIDYEEDKKAGYNTTAVFFGKAIAHLILLAMILTLIILPYGAYPRIVFSLLLLIFIFQFFWLKLFLKIIDIILWGFVILYLVWLIIL